jgi:hypothetical protein
LKGRKGENNNKKEPPSEKRSRKLKMRRSRRRRRGNVSVRVTNRQLETVLCMSTAPATGSRMRRRREEVSGFSTVPTV